MWRVALAVAAGSALGAAVRWGISLALLDLLGPFWGWGTIAANAAGSFLIGLYAALAGPGARVPAGPVAQAFVIAGFCGGFTTFSIFSLETLLLVEAGHPERAALFVGLSVALWIGGVVAGEGAGRRFSRRD